MSRGGRTKGGMRTSPTHSYTSATKLESREGMTGNEECSKTWKSTCLTEVGSERGNGWPASSQWKFRGVRA